MLRNCRLVGMLVVCAFAWVAILTFDIVDWPNPAVWPQADPAHNACGRAGAWFAYHLMYTLGVGVYPLFFLLSFGAGLQLMRRRISDIPLRLAGVLVLMTITAAAAALIEPDAGTGFVEGRGGILGIAVATALKNNLSTFGATLVVAAAYIVGFLLAADECVIMLPRAVAWFHQRWIHIIHTLRDAGRVGPRLSPVMIGAGNQSALADAPEFEPGEEEYADDEDDEVEEEEGEYDAEDEEEYDEEDDDAEDEEDDEVPDRDTPINRDLIIRMLGKDRSEGKIPKSVWPKELGDYVLPPLSLLDDPETNYNEMQETVVREMADILERTLLEFRIDVRVVEIDTGPVITMFELELSAGTKVSQIRSLSNDIARALKAPAVRVVAPIAGKDTIGHIRWGICLKACNSTIFGSIRMSLT